MVTDFTFLLSQKIYRKLVCKSQFVCMKSAPLLFSFLTERGSGEHTGRDRRSLQCHARCLPRHNQHAWKRTRQRALEHRTAGPGLQDAAGHQDQAGAGDRNLQESAGNRGVQVDAMIQEHGLMRPFRPEMQPIYVKKNAHAHFTHGLPLLFSSFSLSHSRPIATGKQRLF